MTHKDFVEILRRYINGNASAEEKRLIDEWYAAMESSGEDIPDETMLLAQFEPIIQEHINSGKRLARTKRIASWCAVAAAASLAIFFIYPFIKSSTVSDEQRLQQNEVVALSWREILNDSLDAREVTLPDGSVVIIEPGGRLKFPEQFRANERRVFLEGQAFFQVSQDTSRPFFVHTGEVTTRVLGTSFTIKLSEKKIVIAVRTGKVSVIAQADSSSTTDDKAMVLTPNQQAVYDRVDEKLLKGIVDTPQPLISRDAFKSIKFKETSASRIFETLEKVYGIDLVFDEDKFSSCLLNTTISDDELYKKLDVICRAIGGSYMLVEDKIIITGKGCLE